MKKILFVCVVLMLGAVLFAQGGSEGNGAINLKIQHNDPQPDLSAWHQGFLSLQDTLKAKYGDQVNVTIYSGGSLSKGNWKTSMEQAQNNVIQMMVESHVPWGTVVPEISALSTPFLFDGMEHQMRFFDSQPAVLQEWVKKFEDKGLVFVGWWPRPSRQNVNNQKQIVTPADIAGMKFRSMGVDLAIKTWEAMGAKPVPMPSGEIYTAIQTGTVAGEDNAISTVYNFKTFEPCKYFNKWDYMADGALIVVNKTWWNNLTPDVQETIKTSLNGSARQVVYDFYQKMEKEARAAMEDYGIVFTDFTYDMKKPWIDKMGPVYDYVKSLTGEEGWNEFSAAVEATR